MKIISSSKSLHWLFRYKVNNRVNSDDEKFTYSAMINDFEKVTLTDRLIRHFSGNGQVGKFYSS